MRANPLQMQRKLKFQQLYLTLILSTRAAFEAVLRWMTWIHVTGCDLIAFGTGKGDGFGVNSSARGKGTH